MVKKPRTNAKNNLRQTLPYVVQMVGRAVAGIWTRVLSVLLNPDSQEVLAELCLLKICSLSATKANLG